ncbi:MAG: acyl-CoA dehydratase activase [bacterium]
MITAGVDCGAKSVKVVVLGENKILGWSLVLAGGDTSAAVEKAFAEALELARVSRERVQKVVATGCGKLQVSFHQDSVTEVSADARGAVYLFPQARTVIDVGAEEARALRTDSQGRLVDFVINDRCAAGAGVFLETMARALELTLEEMGSLALEATEKVCINAQCTVFAESEVVSLVHANTPKPDMARAVHDAIAERIASMVRRVGVEPEVVLVGGVGRNVGVVKALSNLLGVTVRVPDQPELVGALGAAILAAESS